MAVRLEFFLYHAIDTTGLMQVSLVSDTGPWTDLRLTSPKPVSEAVAEWESLAAAAFPTLNPNWYFENSGTSWLTLNGDVTFWVQVSETLGQLLGIGEIIMCPASGGMALGHLESFEDRFIHAGTTLPVDAEEADLAELRGGRAAVYHFGRRTEVDVKIAIPQEFATEGYLDSSPLFSGHGALRVTDVEKYGGPLNPNPFGEDDLDGYLDVYPYDTPSIEHESPDEHVFITLKCTMEDPP